LPLIEQRRARLNARTVHEHSHPVSLQTRIPRDT